MQIEVGELEPSVLSTLQIELKNAIGCHNANQLHDAEMHYRNVLRLEPNNPLANLNLGPLLLQIGQTEEGLNLMGKSISIALANKNTHALLHIGNHYFQSGRIIEAKSTFRQILELEPNHLAALCNLGAALDKLGQFEQARELYCRVLEIEPNHVVSIGNLGSALTELGQLNEAQRCFERVLEVTPECDKIKFALALVLLFQGKFSEGWQKFECRWRGGRNKSPYPKTSLPQWTGQTPAHGDAILIFEEQGFGDQIQFSRYINFLRRHFTGRISVVTRIPLITLFRRSFPDCEFLEKIPEDQQRWQWQCPLMSLPLAFYASFEHIPQCVPYLKHSPKRAAHFKTKISSLNLPLTTRKIGVVWKSGAGKINADLRSIQFESIARLFGQPHDQWFSLQKDRGEDKQKSRDPSQLVDWADEFADFDDTAGLIMNLDLVITVDTSVAHLVGGLGRPVWLLNRFASEWRWMRNRTDSDWYPTMRIFSQREAGVWEDVIKEVSEALKNLS